jgi:hypothetical protein
LIDIKTARGGWSGTVNAVARDNVKSATHTAGVGFIAAL